MGVVVCGEATASGLVAVVILVDAVEAFNQGLVGNGGDLFPVGVFKGAVGGVASVVLVEWGSVGILNRVDGVEWVVVVENSAE